MRPKSSSPSWVFTRAQTRFTLTVPEPRRAARTDSGVNGSRYASVAGLLPSNTLSRMSAWK